MPILIYPEHTVLTNFFGVKPIVVDDEPWVYAYHINDFTGMEMYFSFNIVEGWISVSLKKASLQICNILTEGVISIELEELRGLFKVKTMSSDMIVSIYVHMEGCISMEWWQQIS